jgi:hypothetical protein
VSRGAVTGCEVLIQSQEGMTCTGFVDVGVSRPLRILVRTGEEGARSRASGLVAALEALLDRLGTRSSGSAPPCGGSLHDPCKAYREPYTLNLLVWVGSDLSPDPGEERVVADWLAGHADAAAVAVIPAGADPVASVPDSLRRRQHVRWSGAAGAAQEVIEIAEPDSLERRVFVSYSHGDGVELANAVAGVLSEARFSIFLDSFSLRPGSDFAERIEHELMEKAFIVLIETPQALQSEWVIQHELGFARLNRLGVASVRPEGSSAPLLPGISTRRWTLPKEALRASPGGPALEAEAARALQEFLLARHAESMLQRRATLAGALRAALHQESLGPIGEAGGGFQVKARGSSWHIEVRPRPANLIDMHSTHRRADPGDRGLMVSATPRGMPEREALSWLASESSVSHWDEAGLLQLARALRRGPL